MSRQNIRGPRVVNTGNNGQPQSKEGEEKGMWSSMLDSVASGKKLPEKNVVVLGGKPDTQKEFLETLSSDAPKRPQDRHKRKPVIANEFALGYAYQDVLDADQEDILARLSIYLLSEPSLSFAPLLKPIFTQQSIPESLLVILLDWSEPWHWVRQLRDWIRLLRFGTLSLDNAQTEIMGQVMEEWQQRKRGASTYDTGGSGNGTESNVTLPLGQGEWDEPLGLPLCVVCHGADKIDALEVEHGWREEEFDFVLQFLRTILMKHGASLIYTSNSTPNSLPTLIHSTLGIHSLLKKQALKHNVIDRDKVLIPPNWDSWGKIRVLREGFDVEGTSSGWSVDIQPPPASHPSDNIDTAQPDQDRPVQNQAATETSGGVLPAYESTIPAPRNSLPSNPLSHQPRIEVHTKPTQDFLTTQLETLTRLSAEDAKAAPTTPTTNAPFTFSTKPSERNMNEHIGPVQVNMGGIQVDADDMLKKLKSSRERERSDEGKADLGEGTVGKATEEEQKAENEKLSSFFANLIKKGSSGSPRGASLRDGKGSASGSASGSGRETPSKKRVGS